jgi:hypothetical protein
MDNAGIWGESRCPRHSCLDRYEQSHSCELEWFHKMHAKAKRVWVSWLIHMISRPRAQGFLLCIHNRDEFLFYLLILEIVWNCCCHFNICHSILTFCQILVSIPNVIVLDCMVWLMVSSCKLPRCKFGNAGWHLYAICPSSRLRLKVGHWAYNVGILPMLVQWDSWLSWVSWWFCNFKRFLEFLPNSNCCGLLLNVEGIDRANRICIEVHHFWSLLQEWVQVCTSWRRCKPTKRC